MHWRSWHDRPRRWKKIEAELEIWDMSGINSAATSDDDADDGDMSSPQHPRTLSRGWKSSNKIYA